MTGFPSRQSAAAMTHILQALPKGEDLGEELFKLGIGTVVGVELIQAAQSRRTEVVFVCDVPGVKQEDLEITLSKAEDLEKAKPLIELSYGAS